MESRITSIDTFIPLLEAYSFIELKEKFDLYVYIHSTHNISILNYGKISNFGQTSETDCCRGLVIESTFPFSIISRGFDRFIPSFANESHVGPLDLLRATIKEDGSLIFLFKYKDAWMLSTMHDFADNKLPFADFSYSDLFHQIIDQPLDSIAEGLYNQFSPDDGVMTFCFEMCSIYNRVIRFYETPTLFLITAFGGHKGASEISIPQTLSLPNNVKHITEIIFPSPDTTFEDVQERIKELSRNECTFEGMVLQTCSGRRIKAKNPYYLLQHSLKYRGFTKATPEVIVPLLFDRMDDIIISNVVDSLGGDLIVQHELIVRRDLCRAVLESELHDINAVLNDCRSSETGEIDYGMSIKERILQLEGGQHSAVFRKWKGLLLKLFRNSALLLDDEYRAAFVANLKVLFPRKKDICLSSTHPNHACPILTNTILPPETYTQVNDGLGASSDLCYCGQPMRVSRLRSDATRYRTCHCGAKYGYLTYKSGTFLSVCSDPTCLCTHEVNQHTHKPLGIPSSNLCKAFRLQAHELMSTCGLSRDECYEHIAAITSRSKDNAHMAQMGISDCVKIIRAFCSKNEENEKNSACVHVVS